MSGIVLQCFGSHIIFQHSALNVSIKKFEKRALYFCCNIIIYTVSPSQVSLTHTVSSRGSPTPLPSSKIIRLICAQNKNGSQLSNVDGVGKIEIKKLELYIRERLLEPMKHQL